MAYPRDGINNDAGGMVTSFVTRVNRKVTLFMTPAKKGIKREGLWARIQEAYDGKNAPEIARLLEKQKQSVYRWRDGEVPGIDTLADIAQSRNVSLHWLLLDEGPRSLSEFSGIEPGQVPIYFGPYEQQKLRDLAHETGKTFEQEIRDIVLVEMERRGMINVPEESNVVFFGEPVRSVTVPLMGWIAAGEPIHVVAEPQDVNVPDFFMKRGKSYFVLHVRGDSMIEDQIIDGSLIVCEARQTATDGEKVVAMIDGDKATVKRLYHEGDRVRLQPANPMHKPIYVEPGQRLDIQGVVVGIFHKPS